MNGKEVRVGVSLLVGNMDSMVRFYRDILGFQTQWDGGSFADFETAGGDLSLFMYSREEFVKAIGESYTPPSGINQTFEIALWLPCFADVDAEYERLSKLGVQFPTGAPITYPFGIRNFYVADPEGNLLEIGSANATFQREVQAMVMETKDLALGKAKYEDWESIYRNVWSRPETAKYMLWKLTADETEAKERIQRTIAFQQEHDVWLVYEKKSGQAIGFAGIAETEPHIYEDTGIALGPEYVGKGYGKQILQLLTEYCISLGGLEFRYSTSAGNQASRALAASAGFIYQYSEQKTDPRNGEAYELQMYKKDLRRQGSEA